MWKLNGREWKALLILSVVVPVGLLATFKLSGIFEGPATVADTITLDEAKWEFERPSCNVDWPMHGSGYNIGSSYINDVYLNQTILIDDYWPEKGIFGGSPVLETGLCLTASLAGGHIESVNITFRDNYLGSLVRIRDLDFGGKNQTEAVWYNLTATSYKEGLTDSVEKAFVYLDGVDYPKRVYLSIFPNWVLCSPHNQTQQLNMNVEVTYFNGTVYKKVVQPSELRLIADDNNSFERAEIINSTQLSKEHILGGYDIEDFYKVSLTEGEMVEITVMPSPFPSTDLDLYLYNPINRNNPVATSTNHSSELLESIIYNATSTGWWYIKVLYVCGYGGIYTLVITTV